MTRIRFHGLLAVLALACAAACAPDARPFVPSTSTARVDVSTWSSAGTMASARVDSTATLLRSGYVLVAGGGTSAAELYDPAPAAGSAWAPWRRAASATPRRCWPPARC